MDDYILLTFLLVTIFIIITTICYCCMKHWSKKWNIIIIKVKGNNELKEINIKIRHVTIDG